jgi:hypothetical protein
MQLQTMRRSAIGVLVLLAHGVMVAAQTRDYPNSDRPLAAPNSLLMIVNRDRDDVEPPHSLYLVDRHTGAERRIYSYARSVSVNWSPDSSKIGITDFGGSDFANCVVLAASDGSSVDVSADMKRRPELRPYFENNDHVYCEIVRWMNVDTLLVRIHGYGDRNRKGFNIVRRYHFARKG